MSGAAKSGTHLYVVSVIMREILSFRPRRCSRRRSAACRTPAVYRSFACAAPAASSTTSATTPCRSICAGFLSGAVPRDDRKRYVDMGMLYLLARSPRNDELRRGSADADAVDMH